MRLAVTALIALTLAACSSTQYYMIPGESAAPAQAPAAGTEGAAAALRNLTLPDYLTDQFVIYYDNNGQVNRTGGRRWADDPEDNIRRVLYQDLVRLTAPAKLYSYPLGENIRPAKLLDVQIHEMIGYAAAREFRASADWQTSAGAGSTPAVHHFEKTYPMTSTKSPALIAHYRQAIADLAAAIAPSLSAH